MQSQVGEKETSVHTLQFPFLFFGKSCSFHLAVLLCGKLFHITRGGYLGRSRFLETRTGGGTSREWRVESGE